MTQFWEPTSRIQQGLNRVRDFLQAEIERVPEFLRDSLQALASRGKGLRPGLVLLPYPEDHFPDKLIRIAAAMELLHLATLIHDDVVDQAELRRGVPTISSQEGHLPAVLLGDLLFSRCFEILSADAPRESAKSISQVMALMASTELIQWNSRFHLDSSLRRLRRISAGKTSSLFSLALFAGAEESGWDPKQSAAFRKLGYLLGMGFQIQDDHLNLWGKEKDMGKPRGSDILSGQYTLPIILAYGKYPEKTRNLLERFQKGDDELEILLQFLDSKGLRQDSELAWKGYYQKSEKLAQEILMPTQQKDMHLILEKLKKREK